MVFIPRIGRNTQTFSVGKIIVTERKKRSYKVTTVLQMAEFVNFMKPTEPKISIRQLKSDGTRAETRFRLPLKTDESV